MSAFAKPQILDVGRENTLCNCQTKSIAKPCHEIKITIGTACDSTNRAVTAAKWAEQGKQT